MRDPFLAALDDRLGPALDRARPTFDARAQLVHGGWQLAAWIVLSGVLVGYGVFLSPRGSADASRLKGQTSYPTGLAYGSMPVCRYLGNRLASILENLGAR